MHEICFSSEPRIFSTLGGGNLPGKRGAGNRTQGKKMGEGKKLQCAHLTISSGAKAGGAGNMPKERARNNMFSFPSSDPPPPSSSTPSFGGEGGCCYLPKPPLLLLLLFPPQRQKYKSFFSPPLIVPFSLSLSPLRATDRGGGRREGGGSGTPLETRKGRGKRKRC